jgi:hypothetical protein
LALTSIPFAVACGETMDAGIAYDPDVDPSEFDDASVEDSEGYDDKAALNVSTERAKSIAAAAPKDASGLPLWESRPGAKVALFLDFDGGRYDSQNYRGIDRDGNRSRFGTDEQIAIIRAALEVVEGYKGFDINVTTSEAAMRKARKWGWILITDDESTSGEAYVGSIARSSQCSGSSCYPKGFAGSQAVFSPPSAQRGYLLIHELGHQFGLNHSGLYKNGSFVEWSDLKQGRTSDWMGGRSSYFSDYTWVRSQTKYSTSWQDPVKVIGSVAGTVSGGDSGGGSSGGGSSGGGSSGGGGSCHTVPPRDSNYCTSSCPCNEGEGDCDNDSQCSGSLKCEERGSVDICVKPSTTGGASCNLPAVNKGNGGTGYGECQGDCDKDSDCQSGLRCVQRDAGDPIPGCSGRSSSRNDYCARPECI